MRTALLAIVVLVVVFGGLVSTVLVYQRLRRFLDRRAFRLVPDHLTLKNRQGKWRDTVLMQTLTSPLAARGFSDVGDFTINELPGISLRLLLNTQDMVLAAIYEHARAGHWIELVSYFQDGTSMTYSTNPSAILASRPGFIRFKGLGLNPGALYTKFKNDRPTKPLLQLTPEDAVARFVAAYTDETTWRKQRGILPDELSAIFRDKAFRSRLST